MKVLAERVFQASEENLPDILAWIEEITLAQVDFSCAMKIQLAAEEAVVNVVQYAYQQEDKNDCPLVLVLSQDENTVKLTLRDKGVPFNPIENISADPTKALDERELGGWGRALMLQTAQQADYVYELGENILTLSFQPLVDG